MRPYKTDRPRIKPGAGSAIPRQLSIVNYPLRPRPSLACEAFPPAKKFPFYLCNLYKNNGE